MKKRIKDTPVSPETYRSEFANIYRRAIEFYLGTPKEESVYVEDPELERELMRLFLDCESKIIYFLGKEGIGKTTFLKNVFGLSDNAVVFDEAKGKGETYYGKNHHARLQRTYGAGDQRHRGERSGC